MLQLTADRLVLVDKGTAIEFDGTLDDYTAMVLQGDNEASAKQEKKLSRKDERRAAAAAREKSQSLRSEAKAAEAEVARLTALRARIEHAMFDPSGADPALTSLTMTELMKRRADTDARIAVAETKWLEASQALEAAAG
jgi:ATP-binding cassette subfamily F protein 3